MQVRVKAACDEKMRIETYTTDGTKSELGNIQNAKQVWEKARRRPMQKTSQKIYLESLHLGVKDAYPN